MKRSIKRETTGNPSDHDPASQEKLTGLFEADVLIHHEYDLASRSRLRSPEEELMAAVLEQAIADCQRYVFSHDKKSRRHFLDAEAWISDGDNDRMLSFTDCCSVLGIEPGYLRRGLARRMHSGQEESFL